MTNGIGVCACGCGGKTSVAIRTRRERGHVKGEPFEFIQGHNRARVAKPIARGAEPEQKPNYYTEAAAKQFIHYLLCWKHWGYRDAIFRRSPDKYRDILQKVINQGRTDQAGVYEIAAAKMELAALGVRCHD